MKKQVAEESMSVRREVHFADHSGLLALILLPQG